MISTLVLPGAQTIGVVSGSGASPFPPSLGPWTPGLGARDSGLEVRDSGLGARGSDEVLRFPATASAPAVIATVAGTTSVSKLSSTILDSGAFLPRFSAK